VTTHGLGRAGIADQVQRVALADVNASCAELARGGEVPNALAIVNAWRAAQLDALAAADVLGRLATIDEIRATRARASRRCALRLARRVEALEALDELLVIAGDRARARSRSAAPVRSWCVTTRAKSISTNAPPSLAAYPKDGTV